MWYGSRPNREQRAQVKAAREARRQEPFVARFKRETRALFWQLDFIGLVLFVIGFGLFFVTITTANSRTARWSDAHSIAQLVLGAVFIGAFVVYERLYAPHPLIPFALIKRKTVIGCMLVALLSPMGGRITSQYLVTFLQVSAGVRPFKLEARMR
jgi:SIT family siderophore-iron:H+ symporter-like MFS transporter